MRINAFDDGLRPELLEHSFYDGIFEIPRLEPLERIVEPAGLVPFSKRQKARDRFVHFYEHEAHYQDFTNHPEKYIKDLLEHPGIISPDNSILVEAPLCAQIANLFISRRNASFLQHSGVYQIPHNSIVSIGTYGCCQTQDEKRLMHLGVVEMLKVLHPQIIVVYGSMPKDVFCDFPYEPRFLQFDNWDKERHA